MPSSAPASPVRRARRSTRSSPQSIASGIPVLAIDIPSGLDCDTGKPLGACVQATKTITFVAEKVGFAAAECSSTWGQVEVAGIGCPVEIIDNG